MQMEIVKTGELLESQIIEDARARARRLLEAADDECKAIHAEGEARLQEEVRLADRAQEARRATLRRELDASLPLDFRRTRLAFLQESVEKGLAAYFASLSSEDLARIIGRQLSRGAAAFAGKRIVLRYAGMDPARARRAAAESLPDASVEAVSEMTPQEAEAAGKGLIVECSDGSRRCRATIGEITINLLEEHREELVTALYGKDTQA